MNHYILAIAIFGLFCTLPLSSQATPISKDAANAFYASCRSQQDPRMTPETQDAMCACNAAMMMEHMSVEDVDTMKEQSQAGREKLNKMLLEVYAPCMNYPVHDLVEAQCLSNENISKAGIKMPKEEICSCAAEKMAEWFAEEGSRLMRTILEKQPNIYDPIGPVMESQDFKSHSYSSMISCATHGG